MKVVSDTNVVVAGIVAEGLCREILEIHVPEHTAILSHVLWAELEATLRRRFGLTLTTCLSWRSIVNTRIGASRRRSLMRCAAMRTMTGCWLRRWPERPRRS